MPARDDADGAAVDPRRRGRRRAAEADRETPGRQRPSHGGRDQTAASALAWLKQDSPSLILLDYSLPDMRGEQLVEQIQAQGRRVPFVVATGHGSESVAVEMMKRGAYDYLVKGATFMQLLPAVVGQALERARQAQRLIQAEEQLREAHEELELRVQQRTAELAEANQRLRVEMEERRRAEEQVQQHQAELAHVARLSTVGEMVVELTHELNQPLSAISSYAQACKRLLAFRRAGRPGGVVGLAEPGGRAGRPGRRDHPPAAPLHHQGQAVADAWSTSTP